MSTTPNMPETKIPLSNTTTSHPIGTMNIRTQIGKLGSPNGKIATKPTLPSIPSYSSNSNINTTSSTIKIQSGNLNSLSNMSNRPFNTGNQRSTVTLNPQIEPQNNNNTYNHTSPTKIVPKAISKSSNAASANNNATHQTNHSSMQSNNNNINTNAANQREEMLKAKLDAVIIFANVVINAHFLI
jgi:hypothetical protein